MIAIVYNDLYSRDRNASFEQSGRNKDRELSVSELFHDLILVFFRRVDGFRFERMQKQLKKHGILLSWNKHDGLLSLFCKLNTVMPHKQTLRQPEDPDHFRNDQRLFVGPLKKSNHFHLFLIDLFLKGWIESG